MGRNRQGRPQPTAEPTKRNEVTYGPVGLLRLCIYGCTTSSKLRHRPEGTRTRAYPPVEPVEGIETMRLRRGAMKDTNLTSGPGKLCIAFDLARRHNGSDLTGDEIWIEKYENGAANDISLGKRVGIDYAQEDADAPVAFWVTRNGYVSRPAAGNDR